MLSCKRGVDKTNPVPEKRAKVERTRSRQKELCRIITVYIEDHLLVEPTAVRLLWNAMEQDRVRLDRSRHPMATGKYELQTPSVKLPPSG